MLFGLKPRQDGSGRFDDPEGVGSPSANVIFQSDMEAATGELNGFDDVRATESGGSSTITFVDDGSGNNQVAQFNLIAGGLQDVWLRENFGDFHSVGDPAQNDLWIPFTWLVDNLAALNPSSTNKVATIQFSDGVTSTRTFQIIITAIDTGSGHVFRIEHLWFNRSNGGYVGSRWLGSFTTDTITPGQVCYLKLHLVNSTNGASDGSVDLWFNDTLVVSAQNEAINDANGDSPNSLIFGTYNGSQASTANGYVQYDRPLVQDQDPGSWAPSSLPTWTGFDDASGDVTAANSYLDLRDDLATAAPNLPRLTNGATRVHVPNGGFYGQGCNRFTPNYDVSNQYCGIGQIHGFPSVGDATRVVMGVLMRIGQGFEDVWMSSSHTKPFIFDRDEENNPTYWRPMGICKGGVVTKIIAPATGTVCNCTDNAADNQLHNDVGDGSLPDQNLLNGVWQWVEFAMDCNGPNGLTRIKTWSEDSVYQGQMLQQWMTNSDGGGATAGGQVEWLDVLGGYLEMGAAPGGSPADPWIEIEYVRFQVGSIDDITPPPTFPGHNAANW